MESGKTKRPMSEAVAFAFCTMVVGLSAQFQRMPSSGKEDAPAMALAGDSWASS
jgi:hypothetical protein